MQRAKRQKTKTQNRSIFNILSEDVFIEVCLPFLSLKDHCRVARLCKYVHTMMDRNPAHIYWNHSKKKQVLISRKTSLTTWKRLSHVCKASYMLILDCHHLQDIKLEWGFPLSGLTVFRSNIDISFVTGMSSLKYLHLRGSETEKNCGKILWYWIMFFLATRTKYLRACISCKCITWRKL